MLSVKVKWGRELYTDIVVNTDEEPILFKAQLFALTGVEPDRQKVMCKGGILKDDQWNLQLKDVSNIAKDLRAVTNLIVLIGSCCFVAGQQGKCTRSACYTGQIHRRHE